MKTFILLSAVPGCGKSTWAEEYKLTHKNVFIVSSDNLRKEIGGAIQNAEHEQEVWDRFRSDILKFRDFSDDVTVIADATNITNGHRKAYAEHAKGFDKKILMIFKKSKDEVEKGNKARGNDRIVPDFAMDSMMKRWEDVNDETASLYDEVIIIDKHFDAPHVKEEFHYI